MAFLLVLLILFSSTSYWSDYFSRIIVNLSKSK